MATDYKNTLNLPRTDFAMRADLVAREPERLKKWEAAQLYEKIQQQRDKENAPKFVLHDGPPFANGDVHIGTALNKILKDIIVKYKTLRGFSAPYIPGWDCHGLPIEFKVSQDMRKAGDTSADAATIRKACEAYARKYIDIQRTQFKRLGVLGDWENPYLTLNKEYEADELRLFADIVAKGFVYRGKKPVYWSIPCRTALAEAEVEYHNHVSQSIYVKFPIVGMDKTFALIWTTTPWTLPANLGIAFNSKLTYFYVEVESEMFLIAKDLLPIVADKCKWERRFRVVNEISQEELERLNYRHPFISRRHGKFHAAEFVDNKTGTGFVHIAPGHGREDYLLGQYEKLKTYSPVDDDGRLAYTTDFSEDSQMPPELIGKLILEKNGKSEANEAVLDLLRHKNVLLHHETFEHSYPHCWRSKTPVIFRAMDQWFIRIDHVMGPPGGYAGAINMKTGVAHFSGTTTFREDAVAEIGKVNWIPDWGVNRIKGAVETRPDWCISRQRSWGVPLPAFYDADGNAILEKEVIDKVADLIQEKGSNVWFEQSAAELWKQVRPANWNRPEAISKSNDTLDVWIDSGSSSRAVLKQRKELQHNKKSGDEVWQADIYLEGSDQHRGWFQSSLLLSLAGNNAVPFKKVLTHGFMVDADREKISKSKQGGYEKPQTSEAYVKKYGADVVRLWVASQDYRSDIVVSEERINKVGETYRGIRNALRYQLSNLYDFDPAKHSVPDEKLTGLDRWILGEFAKLEAEVLAAYDQYEFHVVYQKLSQFIAVELSSVYHDVIKDRLYTDAANSPRRRSTQTALHRLVTGLCQMLAPILAFTADEAWEFVPGKNVNSVHESEFKLGNFEFSENEQRIWKSLLELRRVTLPELEKFRQSKIIGKSLEAKLDLVGNSKALVEAPQNKENLRELLNVSQLQVHVESPTHPSNAQNLSDLSDVRLDRLNLRLKSEYFGELVILVSKADGQKCERCWHWETDIGKNAEHPTICGRCVEAVMQAPDVSVKL
jgi:isoleucyl-tRNA synthetase